MKYNAVAAHSALKNEASNECLSGDKAKPYCQLRFAAKLKSLASVKMINNVSVNFYEHI